MNLMNGTITTRICECALNKTFLNQLAFDKERDEVAADATWILTSAFIIFTMQSGFGLLEAGLVSSKNECNIMIKNVIDVLFGGVSYWLVGFGLSFGEGEYSNPFCGVGYFLMGAANKNGEEDLYAKYFFQLSFATTATTIVSGAMCERAKLESYMAYSFLNVLVYALPVHWVWADNGFLKTLGVIDNAGCGPVHIVGGVSSLVATYLLRPRHGKFEKDVRKSIEHEMASPTNMVLGTFMLWWGWLGINCGSTFGVSGNKWRRASRAAVATINASISGGIYAILYSIKLTKKYDGKLDVRILMSGILGGLVSITAINSICQPWEALLIGLIGSMITCSGITLIERLELDDPVSCIPVHGLAGIWGMIAVGLFADEDNEGEKQYFGLIKGGGWRLLGVQLLASTCIAVWAALATFLHMQFCRRIFGLRVDLGDEILGADYIKHGIKRKDLFCELKEDLEYVMNHISKEKMKRAVSTSNRNILRSQMSPSSSFMSIASKRSFCLNDFSGLDNLQYNVPSIIVDDNFSCHGRIRSQTFGGKSNMEKEIGLEDDEGKNFLSLPIYNN